MADTCRKQCFGSKMWPLHLLPHRHTHTCARTRRKQIRRTSHPCFVGSLGPASQYASSSSNWAKGTGFHCCNQRLLNLSILSYQASLHPSSTIFGPSWGRLSPNAYTWEEGAEPRTITEPTQTQEEHVKPHRKASCSQGHPDPGPSVRHRCAVFPPFFLPGDGASLMSCLSQGPVHQSTLNYRLVAKLRIPKPEPVDAPGER